MACGSVYAKESQKLGRDLTNMDLTGGTDRTLRASPSIKSRTLHQDNPPGKRKEFGFSHRNGHEAVRFLQAEHEKVLSGLHQQMQELQKKCDDLQFEAHLRHVTEDGESTWKDRVSDLTQNLEQREAVIAELQRELDYSQCQAEELTQQTKWREVQLQQQIQTGEQKIVELKEECMMLRAKVSDLKIYNAALRRGDQGDGTNIRPGSSNSYIPEDLNDGPLSLESEESFSGGWREARYSNSQARRTRKTSGTSVDKPPQNQQYLSLSSSFDLSGAESPAKLKRGGGVERPGSVVLPPINLSQSVGRPQFRQHMRFLSAPPTETKSIGAKRRPSDAAVPRRKYAE